MEKPQSEFDASENGPATGSGAPRPPSLLDSLRKLLRTLRKEANQVLAEIAKIFRLNRAPAGRLIAISAVITAGSSALAYWQLHRPYSWHEEREAFANVSWWFQPLERNVDAGLPNIVGGIRAVAVQPSAGSTEGKVWIAGDKGLLVFTVDGGRIWEQVKYDASTGEFRRASSGSSRPATTAEMFAPRLTAVVHAAAPDGNRLNVQSTATQSPTQQTPSQINAPLNLRSPDAVASLLASSPRLDFGEVPLNSESGPQDLTLTNPTGTEVSLYSVAVPNPKTFRVVPESCVSRPLVPKANCSVQIFFRPPTTGPQSAYLEIVGASRKPFRVSHLIGVGVPAARTPAAAPSTSTTQRQNAGTSASRQPENNKTVQFPVEAPNLVAIDFPAGKPGVMATENGTIYSTKDEGESWQQTVIDPSVTKSRLRVGTLEIPIVQNSSAPASASGPVLPPINGIYGADGRRTYRIRSTQTATTLEATEQDALGSALSWQMLGIWRVGDPAISSLWVGKDSRLWLAANLVSQRASQLWIRNAQGRWDQQGCRFQSDTAVSITGVAFDDAGRKGWLVGDRGEVLTTEDGGKRCRPLTRRGAAVFVHSDGTQRTVAGTYGRSVAPWYLLSLFLPVVLLSPLVSGRREAAPAEAPVTPPPTVKKGGPVRPQQQEFDIANMAVSDKPLEPGQPDVLGLTSMAGGLSFFLRNKDTQPPLSIAVTGR